MKQLEKPNYTQTPNSLFDDMLPSMGYAELKVVLYLIRQTLGFHVEKSSESVRDIAKATGLSDRRVQDGLDRAIKRGIVSKTTEGNSKSEWQLNFADHDVTSTRVDVTSTPKRILHDVTSTHTSNKENNTSQLSTTRAITDAYQGVVPYPVDWSAGEGRAAKWLAKAGYSGQQVADCYRHLKAQPFWRDKPLSLASLKKQIGEYVKLHPSAATAAGGVDYNKFGYTPSGKLVELK